jgi:hypothetical protein
VPPHIRRFTAIGAELDHPETQHDWQYLIYLDGQLACESPLHKAGSNGTPIDVEIPYNCKTIILKILSGLDGKGLANTCWGYPYFWK